ncbi:ribosomal 60S subunit protein L43B [Starmerella bacillaris]|uniref:Ribosomal 60S subunit protein L43B n=1 Tax=Starmerella bacillaris TaxID=1247836 RepID=A0AAV5RMB7_STABA|nr:ribosomal 60S subunit protein L43B [Starmerella bacillaris]
MARRTKKVGISGRYGVRYGASLRRQARKIEQLAHTRYEDPFSGKKNVRRVATGIWYCPSSGKTVAGGAYSMSTSAAVTARSTIRRLRELADA